MTDFSQILSSENFLQSDRLDDYEGFSGCNTSGPIVNGSVPTRIAEGISGYGDWGYSFYHDDLSNCESGDEIWWRLYTRWPTDFRFESSPGQMKSFRIGRVKKHNDENRGYVDWYIANGGGNFTKGIVEFEDRAPGNSSSWDTYEGSELDLGEWNMMEVYCYLHPVNGIMRMWKDGNMVGEFVRPTIADPESEAETRVSRLLWLTYYNGNSPCDQQMEFSHHAVAIKSKARDDTPYLSTDSHGNFCLGVGVEDGEIPVEPPIEPTEPPVIPPPVDPIDPPVVPIPVEGATMHVDKHAVHVYTELPVVVYSTNDDNNPD
jgi:hypothetical protein